MARLVAEISFYHWTYHSAPIRPTCSAERVHVVISVHRFEKSIVPRSCFAQKVLAIFKPRPGSGPHTAPAAAHMADEGGVPAVVIDEPAGGEHAAATRSGDAPARGKRKSTEPKAVAFKLMPPSYAAEVLASADSAVGPQPPADRPLQLKAWHRAADAVLKRAWKALSAVEQNDVLQRFPLERPVPWKDAPKAWISEKMGGMIKDVDPDGYASRLKEVQDEWLALASEAQHEARSAYGRKKHKTAAADTAAPPEYLSSGGTQQQWADLLDKSRAAPGFRGPDGMNVYDWIEKHRQNLASAGAERTEHLTLPRMAVPGEDTGVEVWKKRRPFTSKVVDDAFRNGEWSGRQAEWDALEQENPCFRTREPITRE